MYCKTKNFEYHDICAIGILDRGQAYSYETNLFSCQWGILHMAYDRKDSVAKETWFLILKRLGAKAI
jgi:hypothetical protein